MGKIATGFQPRFIKNMTNVDFGSLLSAGDLKDMDFDGDSVSIRIWAGHNLFESESIQKQFYNVIYYKIQIFAKEYQFDERRHIILLLE